MQLNVHGLPLQIPLDNMVVCAGGVEIWLGKLLDEMQSTVQSFLAGIATQMLEPDFNFIVDFQEYCGQVSANNEMQICVLV